VPVLDGAGACVVVVIRLFGEIFRERPDGSDR